MVNKGPKTTKGKNRKLWTGDGRRRTPDEEFVKIVKDTEKSMKGAMKGASSGKKKNQAKRKK